MAGDYVNATAVNPDAPWTAGLGDAVNFVHSLFGGSSTEENNGANQNTGITEVQDGNTSSDSDEASGYAYTTSSGISQGGGSGAKSFPLGENEYRLMTPTEVEEYRRRQANPSNATKNDEEVSYSSFYGNSKEDEEVSYSSFYGHAKGLSYVPYDNYMALLHRGEEVLTATQAEKRRNGEGFDLSGMYEAVAAAVRAGVSSIAVNLDGRRVGEIVSRHQAAQTETELMSRGYVMT